MTAVIAVAVVAAWLVFAIPVALWVGPMLRDDLALSQAGQEQT